MWGGYLGGGSDVERTIATLEAALTILAGYSRDRQRARLRYFDALVHEFAESGLEPPEMDRGAAAAD